ncbi:uncharacterized [Tachysurus ichikawai]
MLSNCPVAVVQWPACLVTPQQLGDPPDIRVSSPVGGILLYTHSLIDGVPLPTKQSRRLLKRRTRVRPLTGSGSPSVSALPVNEQRRQHPAICIRGQKQIIRRISACQCSSGLR